MSKFPSLPKNPHLRDAMSAHSEGFGHLCDYHDVILRGPSPLTVADRELIAAYVSGLNQCNFCHSSHRAYAEAQGIDPDIFENLMADPASAGVDPKLLPILAYAKKLTLAPATVTEGDAAAVYNAGWNEKALFHAIAVTGIFNLMNRIVEGMGVVVNPAMLEMSKQRMTADLDNPTPYKNFSDMLKKA